MRRISRIGLLLSISVLLLARNSSTDVIPAVPDPPRLVNDFAGVLSASDVARLEHQLVAFK